MFNSIIPLVDWGMGTALIVFFALVCIGLTIVVLSLVFSGPKKGEETEISSDATTEPLSEEEV